MPKLKLTLACGDYEITRPLTDGTVQAEGIEFVSDTRYGAKERHWAMARDDAYDVCEFNAPLMSWQKTADAPGPRYQCSLTAASATVSYS